MTPGSRGYSARREIHLSRRGTHSWPLSTRKIWWYSFEFQGRRVQESSGLFSLCVMARIGRSEASARRMMPRRKGGNQRTLSTLRPSPHICDQGGRWRRRPADALGYARPHEDPDDDALRSSGRRAEENRSREAQGVSDRWDRAGVPKKSGSHYNSHYSELRPTKMLAANSLKNLAGPTGLEPATSCVTGRRSNQTELRPRIVFVSGGQCVI